MPQCSRDEPGDSLFLLEVLVKDVHYSYSNINLDKNYLRSLGETCVLVKFLHYPPMEIHQDISSRGVDYNCPDVAMGTGKSCLFSLNKASMMRNQRLNIVFNVVRMTPDGSSNRCVTFGKAIGDLSKNFLALMKQSCSSSQPATKCINETYTITNDQCRSVGTISVFLRLSCFGNQITTQFKMSSGDKESFVFKGEDARDRLEVPSECFKMPCDSGNEPEGYREPFMPNNYPGVMGYPVGFDPTWGQPPMDYWGGGGGAMQMAPGICSPGIGVPQDGGYGAPQGGGYGVPQGFQGYGPPPGSRGPGGGYDLQNDGMYQYGKPWGDQDDQPCGGGASSRPPPKPQSPPSPCGGVCGGGSPCPPQAESVASPPKMDNIGKNGQGIPNFPKNYPFCQRVTIGEETESEDTPIPEGPKLNLCDCDFPVPPGLLPPPCPPKKKKKKKPPCPLEMQPGDYCMRPDCPCGLQQVPWLQGMEEPEKKENKNAGKFTMAPGSVGMKGKQIIFQMNDKEVPLTEADKKFMASTQYKVGAIGEKNGQKNIIQVIPDKLDEPPDKDHDVFILKICKKNDENKKSKMEVELRSPKYEDTTPKKMDNETQWLDSDLPAASPKGKKDKGGKGGKGGKGKKKGKK